MCCQHTGPSHRESTTLDLTWSPRSHHPTTDIGRYTAHRTLIYQIGVFLVTYGFQLTKHGKDSCSWELGSVLHVCLNGWEGRGSSKREHDGAECLTKVHDRLGFWMTWRQSVITAVTILNVHGFLDHDHDTGYHGGSKSSSSGSPSV